MRAWRIERIGAHAVEPPVLTACVQHAQEPLLRNVAPFEVKRLERAVDFDDVTDGVDTGVRYVAIADVEGQKAGVVCECVDEMTSADVGHATGPDVEVLQTLYGG